MATTEIERGWTVYSEDNKRVGDVVEVHPHYLLVSRGLVVVRDVYVPRYAVAAAEDRKVRLAITDERLRKMGWNSPPPAPPEPVDGPTPRIVPPVESDATDAFPPFDDDPDGAPLAGDDVASDDDPFANFLTPAPVDDDYADDYADMGVFFGSTIEVDGGAYLAVRQLGEGPAVVLVHGWGVDRRVWDYLTLDLPRSHNVVTYDARGYGGSTAPWGGYTTEQASRDLRVILRTLDLRDATIVALDSGAATALRYVLSGGRRAARLILIAPTISPEGAAEGGEDTTGTEGAAEGGEDTTGAGNGAGNGAAPALATRDEAAGLPEGADIAPVQALGMSDDAAGGVSGMAREWDEGVRRDRPRLAAQLAALWTPDASPETRAWLGEGMLAAAPHALLDGLDMLTTPDLGGALADVSLPTTVLVGRDDPLAPLAAARALVDAIPGARLVTLDTPGHLPMLSDPARVAAEIRAARDVPGEGSGEEQEEQEEQDAADATSATEPDAGGEAIGAE